MKLWLVPIFAVFVGSLYGQDYRPGYIIKINGDSLSGFVENVSIKNSRVCYFKVSQGKKKEVFNPDQLRSYGIFDYKHYVSKVIPVEGRQKKNVFVEILVKGNASLYKHHYIFYLEKDSITLLPPVKMKDITMGDKPYQVKDNRYIGLLNIILADCHLSAGKTPYREKDLIYLVQNYNRCLGAPGTTYKINKPWTKLNLRAFAAFDQASVSLDGFEKFSIKQSISVPFGMGLDVSSPRISDRVFFSLEAWLVNKSFQGYSEETLAGTIYRTDLYLHPSFLKIPIGVQLNLRRESSTPFVKAGFSQYFLTSVSTKMIEEKETSGVVVTTDYQLTLNKKNQTGVWIGAGYNWRLNHLASIFTEVRYEKNNGFVDNNPGSHSSGSVFNILFGLRF